MIIIVEGIDRVGKTTLCESIIEKYAGTENAFIRFRDDTRYVKNHLQKNVNTEKINTLQNLIEAGLISHVILDRYHITEFVYGGVERAYKNNDMYDVDDRLAVLTETVVLVLVVPVDVKQSSAEHGENLERHLEWYNDFYDASKIPNKIVVDYNTFDNAIEFIDVLLNQQNTDSETEGETTE